MTRLMVLTFWGKQRYSDAQQQEAANHASHAEGAHHAGTPRESPRSMTVPLVVLALGAIFAGYLGVPEGLSGGKIPNYFERLLEPSIAHMPGAHESTGPQVRRGATPDHLQMMEKFPEVSEDHSLELILTGISIIIALAGIGIGWRWFRTRPLWEPPRLLEEKYYVDEAYDAVVIQPIKVGSTNVLWRIIDVHIIDGAVNGAGYVATRVGGAMRYLQSGLARSYVAVVVLGALLIIGYFVMK
jgi:NADH-quinone oxidoreductase subunit L